MSEEINNVKNILNINDWEEVDDDDFVTFREKVDEKLKKRFAKMNLFPKISYKIKHKIYFPVIRKLNNIKYKIEAKFEILTKGYSNNEWWDYAYHTSKRAVILLTKLRNSEWLGCPGNWGCKKCLNYEVNRPMDWDCGCDKFGRWKKAIDDMIFYHSCVAGQYEETTEKYGKISKECYNDIDNLENKKRFLKGRMLYSRYYQELWD